MKNYYFLSYFENKLKKLSMLCSPEDIHEVVNVRIWWMNVIVILYYIKIQKKIINERKYKKIIRSDAT